MLFILTESLIVTGAGGDYAIKIDAQLRSEFGYTDNDIAVLTIGTARFMKTWLSHGTMPFAGEVRPFECDASPWDKFTATVSTEAAPGEGGPLCRLNPYFTESEENADYLMNLFFVDFKGEHADVDIITCVCECGVWSCAVVV